MTRPVRLSARLRIGLAFGALFFLGGLLLLTLVFVLVRRDLVNRDDAALRTVEEGDRQEALEHELRAQVRDQALESLLVGSGAALVALTAASGLAGWAVAGVVLRPVHRITDAAKRASTTSLDHRVNLEGPSDELKDLADTFDGMLDRLESGVEAQRRFAANAAHELRTPLTVIRTATDIGLADPAAPDLVSEAASDIRSATIDAEGLIDKLLELARSEHGIQRTTAIDLAERTSESIQNLEAAAAANHVTIDARLEPADVQGDGALIDLAISNLLNNAVRHNRSGGEVRVRTSVHQDHAVLDVENDGEAIDPENIDELAQPFVRGDRALRSHQGQAGFGLGLSIVQAVVDAHHGRFVLHARTEGGVSSHIELPIAAGSHSANGADER